MWYDFLNLTLLYMFDAIKWKYASWPVSIVDADVFRQIPTNTIISLSFVFLLICFLMIQIGACSQCAAISYAKFDSLYKNEYIYYIHMCVCFGLSVISVLACVAVEKELCHGLSNVGSTQCRRFVTAYGKRWLNLIFVIASDDFLLIIIQLNFISMFI